MRIEDYPRPRNDTGIGFHYYSDSFHFDRPALRWWLPELKQMGASWITLVSDFDAAIPEFFIRELIASEIEPIIRIAGPVRPLDQGSLYALLRAYASWGVHYVHVYNEPNLASEWSLEDWIKPNLVERFMDLLGPCLDAMYQAGLNPLFTPLCPGGDYWDTTFLSSALHYMNERGLRHIHDRMAICIHNYASNRPLGWGRGGRARWSATRPYSCPPESQDQRGYYLFEWYDEIVRARLGYSLPLICGENGLVVGTCNWPDYPVIDEITHSMRTIEMARMVMDGEVPDYVFNNAFWALAAANDEKYELHAWYKRDRTQLPAVRAMKLLKKHPRRASTTQATSSVPKQTISHYLLLHIPPSRSDSRSWTAETLLQAAAGYIACFQPAVGFSPNEASQAQRVTVVANDSQEAQDIEATLRKAGCLVERIEATSERDVQRVMDDLCQRDRRFYYLPDL